MALDAMQLLMAFLLIVIHGHALKPPGYVEPQKELDSRPPRYEYGYDVNVEKGVAKQGKQEERDGIYASGRYYVQGKDSNQDVRYFADDWGFHPAVEYSNAGPHSNSRTKFALGFEAVQQLKNKENNQPQLQGLPETGNLNKEGPQGLQRDSEPTPYLNQQQSAQHLPLFSQSSNQEVENNQPQQIPQPTDPSSSQAFIQSHQKFILPEESNEEHAINLQNNAHTLADLERKIHDIRGSNENLIVSQQQDQLQIEHQQIFILPNQNRQQQDASLQKQVTQSQGISYEQQRVNEELESQNVNQQQFEEFGLKIQPTKQKPNAKLIETTQHLVSGQDVLDINSAITKQQEVNVDSSTAQYSNYHQESNQEQIPYVSTTPCSHVQTSFKEQPIVVADYDESNAQFSSSSSHTEEGTDTFSNTVRTVESITTTYETSLPTTVSTESLAPITADIRLQNIEHHDRVLESEQKTNGKVQIQESIPNYLGKYEYPAALSEQSNVNHSSENMADKAKQDLELGTTLLLFPELPKAEALVQKSYQEVDNHLTEQQLPDSNVKERFQKLQDDVAKADTSSQEVHRYNQEYRENYQQGISAYDAQNLNIDSVHVNQNVPELTRIIQQPFPVRVPYEVPYPVVKQVPVPVTVQKVVEKPVHITKYVEKPVPIPQPYPVEKIVEKPVHIPVHVTRYIDRPYPVEVRVPYPQPYPVEKLVHNIIRQPYPVEVKVPYPVEKIIEKKVPVTVEKIVEKPITRYIDRPYPVEKIVQKSVPHYVDRPYPVKVEVPVPQPFYVRVEAPRPHAEQAYQRGLYQHLHEQNAQQSQQLAFFSNPYAYAPQINQYLPTRKEVLINNNGYLPPKQFNAGYLPPQASDCSHGHLGMDSNDHFGLIPPKIEHERSYTRSFRSARQFDDNSVRMEYGFMPPMVPSLEIDDKGNPIDKNEK